MPFILNHESINNASRITGKYTHIIECIFRTIVEMDKFEERLKKHSVRVRQHFITWEGAREDFLP
ncbi:MAG: hypothetical protein ABIB71_07075 [Candidatus Woesearchaeota archaeon]